MFPFDNAFMIDDHRSDILLSDESCLLPSMNNQLHKLVQGITALVGNPYFFVLCYKKLALTAYPL